MLLYVTSAAKWPRRAVQLCLMRGGCPLQIWVPDVRSSAFARAAHAQSLAVGKSRRARSDQACVDAISAWDDIE